MDEGADLAVISGSGKLPFLIKKSYKKALSITFTDSEIATKNNVMKFEFEKLGFLFDFLKKNSVRRIVMAGAIIRPEFDQSKLDEYTLSIMPKLSAKLIKGDNELLTFIADEFEKKGYQIIGPSEILPNLILKPGSVCGTPYELSLIHI